MGLNILDARITPTDDGASLDTYLVLEDNGLPIADADRLATSSSAGARPLGARHACADRHAPRAAQVRMFTTSTQVTLNEDVRNRRSLLELVAADRPGLLSEIGQVLWQEQRGPARRQDHDRGRTRRGRVLPDRRVRQAARRGAAQARLADALIRALDRRDAAA
jgi:hypothetical protein